MKKLYINLKDWFNLQENVEFSKGLKDTNIVVFPSMPYLYLYSNINGIELGVQDISSHIGGAHTGEISGEHLKDFNVKWAILNHNELRIDNKKMLTNKLQNCITNEINIIVCVKNLEDLKSVYSNLVKLSPKNRIFFAYEVSEIRSFDQIKKELRLLRNYIDNEINFDCALIYGGNISKHNINDYMHLDEIDGLLISRHALDIKELKTMINLVK